jgi:hypothetical protein
MLLRIGYLGKVSASTLPNVSRNVNEADYRKLSGEAMECMDLVLCGFYRHYEASTADSRGQTEKSLAASSLETPR